MSEPVVRFKEVKKRRFPYGFAKTYRRVLAKVFNGEATDEQLNQAVKLVWEIEGDGQYIDQAQAIEWVATAVAITKEANDMVLS